MTEENLLEQLIGRKSIDKILEDNAELFVEQPISEYLKMLCKERGTVPEHVIKKAQLDRTYGHQIFNGTRIPSRDKLIQLAFGFELSLDETQELLQMAGKAVLYVRIKRDVVCIYGIVHRMSVQEVQEVLEINKLRLLSGGGRTILSDKLIIKQEGLCKAVLLVSYKLSYHFRHQMTWSKPDVFLPFRHFQGTHHK